MDGTALAAIASVVVILLAIIGIAYAFKSVSKVRCKALEKHVVRKEVCCSSFKGVKLGRDTFAPT
jgi:hypothetical protein